MRFWPLGVVAAKLRKFLMSSMVARVTKLKKEQHVVAGACTSVCVVLAGNAVLSKLVMLGCFG